MSSLRDPSKDVAKLAIKGMRKVLTGKGRAAECWDNKMTLDEKRVLLLTAKMSRDLAFKKWSELSNSECTRIYNAAYRASQWASNLGLLNNFPEVSEGGLDAKVA